MKAMGFVFVINFRLVMMKFSSTRAICIFPVAAVVYLRKEYSFPIVEVYSVSP